MNITECVPLAGRGLVARRGHLVALTGGTDAGPDPLLTALTAVAYANGDGAALVLAGTRAAAEHGGRPAWACAGVTFGGEVAILVHGEAVALVSVDGSPEAQVTASGSMIPVVGTFTGAVVTVRLVIGPPAPPDPRLWLEAGTVFGGGTVLTVEQEEPGNLIPNDPYASVAATMRPAMEQAVGNMVLRASAAAPAGPVPAPPGVAPGEVYPADALPGPVLPKEVAYPAGCEPTLLAASSVRGAGEPAGEAAAGGAMCTRVHSTPRNAGRLKHNCMQAWPPPARARPLPLASTIHHGTSARTPRSIFAGSGPLN